MRRSIKRIFLKKRTPEQIERAYWQMFAERDAQKREAYWQSIAMQFPKM